MRVRDRCRPLHLSDVLQARPRALAADKDDRRCVQNWRCRSLAACIVQVARAGRSATACGSAIAPPIARSARDAVMVALVVATGLLLSAPVACAQTVVVPPVHSPIDSN